MPLLRLPCPVQPLRKADQQHNGFFSEFRKGSKGEMQQYTFRPDVRKNRTSIFPNIRQPLFVRRNTYPHYSSVNIPQKNNQRIHLSPASFRLSEFHQEEKFRNNAPKDYFNSMTSISSASSPLPVRIFLPNKYSEVLARDGDFISLVNSYTQCHMSTVLSQYNDTPGTIISISIRDRESLSKLVLEFCRKVNGLFAQNSDIFLTTPADSDWLSRGVVVLVPEKAVSMLIGYKGTTINRICKRFNCDIRMLSSQTSHVKPKSFDRLVLFRGADVLNMTNAICHIDSLLNEMIRKRKLSETDFPNLQHTRNSFISNYAPCKNVAINASGLTPFRSNEEVGNSLDHTLPQSTLKEKITQTPLQNTSFSKRRSFHERRETENQSKELLPLYPWVFSINPDLFPNILKTRYKDISIKLVIHKVHEDCGVKLAHETASLLVVAAWIIGNGGTQKKWLEARSGALINIYNRSLENFVENFQNDRVMIIRGTPIAISIAVNLTLMGYETSERHLCSTEECTVRVILSKENSKMFSKKSKSTLRAIAQCSGINLSLLPHLQHDRSIINLDGNVIQKVTAILLVLEYILQKKKRLTLSRKQFPLRTDEPAHIEEEQQHKEIYLSDEAGTNKRLCGSVESPEDTGQVSLKKKEKIEEIPEASFIRHASSNITYPRVITTFTRFKMSVAFPPEYNNLVSKLGAEAFHEIEAMVNYRVGTSVQILRTNSLPTATDQNPQLFPEDSTTTDNPDSFLKFELTGTPIGNSTAVLLLHEVLMNLADSNIVCCEPHNHYLKNDDQTTKKCETLSPACDLVSEKPYTLKDNEVTDSVPFPLLHAASPQSEEISIPEKIKTSCEEEKSLITKNNLE